MPQTKIISGDASAGASISSGDDGTLVLQTGPAGSKVNSLSITSTGIMSDKDGNDMRPVGVGQSYVDFTGSRALDTTYTNNTNRTITVVVGLQAASAGTFYVIPIIGVASLPRFGGASTSGYASLSFAVPPGFTYRVNNGGNALLTNVDRNWVELR